jgi:hypothetical protein
MKKGQKIKKVIDTKCKFHIYIFRYILLKLNINTHLKEVRCKEYNI